MNDPRSASHISRPISMTGHHFDCGAQHRAFDSRGEAIVVDERATIPGCLLLGLGFAPIVLVELLAPIQGDWRTLVSFGPGILLLSLAIWRGLRHLGWGKRLSISRDGSQLRWSSRSWWMWRDRISPIADARLMRVDTVDEKRSPLTSFVIIGGGDSWIAAGGFASRERADVLLAELASSLRLQVAPDRVVAVSEAAEGRWRLWGV